MWGRLVGLSGLPEDLRERDKRPGVQRTRGTQGECAAPFGLTFCCSVDNRKLCEEYGSLRLLQVLMALQDFVCWHISSWMLGSRPLQGGRSNHPWLLSRPHLRVHSPGPLTWAGIHRIEASIPIFSSAFNLSTMPLSTYCLEVHPGWSTERIAAWLSVQMLICLHSGQVPSSPQARAKSMPLSSATYTVEIWILPICRRFLIG